MKSAVIVGLKICPGVYICKNDSYLKKPLTTTVEIPHRLSRESFRRLALLVSSNAMSPRLFWGSRHFAFCVPVSFLGTPEASWPSTPP